MTAKRSESALPSAKASNLQLKRESVGVGTVAGDEKREPPQGPVPTSRCPDV